MAQDVVFVKDPVSWNKEFHSWLSGGILGRWMENKVAKAVTSAKARAPSRTGELRASITPRFEHWNEQPDLEGQVMALSKHAKYVLSGTIPHVILPEHAEVLSFPWARAGRIVHFSHVRHPGTLPNPFLTAALHDAM